MGHEPDDFAADFGLGHGTKYIRRGHGADHTGNAAAGPIGFLGRPKSLFLGRRVLVCREFEQIEVWFAAIARFSSDRYNRGSHSPAMNFAPPHLRTCPTTFDRIEFAEAKLIEVWAIGHQVLQTQNRPGIYRSRSIAEKERVWICFGNLQPLQHFLPRQMQKSS